MDPDRAVERLSAGVQADDSSRSVATRQSRRTRYFANVKMPIQLPI